MQELIGLRVYIYGQQESVKDMIAVNLAAGVLIICEALAKEIVHRRCAAHIRTADRCQRHESGDCGRVRSREGLRGFLQEE